MNLFPANGGVTHGTRQYDVPLNPVIVSGCHNYAQYRLNSMALVRERTITTERPPPVGEVSANFCG